MAEKGDLPPDNISLPPTYASSETFTESPPPAYKRDKSTQVYVARLACMTIITAALLCGFFITFSAWINTTKSCNCPQQHNVPSSQAARAGLLVSLPPASDNIDPVTNDIIEAKLKKEKLNTPDQSLEAIDEEVSKMEEVEKELQKEEEILENSLKKELESLKRKIKLPVDMLLGNPRLAGKDIQCDVEKKIHNIGGIAAHAILVTCKDEDGVTSSEEEEEESMEKFKPKSSIRPPLSFLAPIMKMLTAKARSDRLNNRISKPKIVVHPLSGSIPRPLEHHGMKFQPLIPNRQPMPFSPNNIIPLNIKQIQGPFMGPMPRIFESGTIHNPIRRFDAGPMPQPQVIRPFPGRMEPVNMRINNPFNVPFNPPMSGPITNKIDEGLVEQIIKSLPIPKNMNNPIIRIEERRAMPFNSMGKGPMNIIPIQRKVPMIPLLPSLPNNIQPSSNDHHHHDNHHNNDGHHIQVPTLPHHQMPPPPPPVFEPPRAPRIIEAPNRPERIIVEKVTKKFPFPLPKNVIPMPSFPLEMSEGPKLIKIFPNIRSMKSIAAAPLLTPDAPYFENDKEEEQKKPKMIDPFLSPENFLPLARGLPPTPEEIPEPRNDEPTPTLPNASGRALSPPISLKFLPRNLFGGKLPEIFSKRIVTHMELRKVPELKKLVQPDADLKPPKPEPSADSDVVDFGPPKDHSIMIHEEEDHTEEPIEESSLDAEEIIPDSPLPGLPPQFPPRMITAKHPFLPPDFPFNAPPVFMNPEGKTASKIPELNPDSEIIAPDTLATVEASVEVMESTPIPDSDAVHSNNQHVIMLN